MRLTAAAIERMKPPSSGQTDCFDELLPGFGIRLSYSGTKAWFVMVRTNGKLIRTTLGRHPALSLSAARDQARQVKTQAEAGIDPRAVKKAAKADEAERLSNTFGGLADQFIELYATPNLRPATVREYNRALRGPDAADLTNKPISDIYKRDILNILEHMAARGSPAAAGRMRAYLGKFFSWCIDHDYLTSSPTERIKPPHLSKGRNRVLSENEIRAIWQTADRETGLFGLITKLLLLTGQRRMEVAGMFWAELENLAVTNPLWRIPGTRTKNHQPHLVPLSSSVVEILEKLPRTSELVFSTNGKTPLSGFSKAKARMDIRISEHHEDMPAWTYHDLRRTMVTIMNEELRIPPHVVEAVVNHMSGSAKRGVAGVYNRALYLEERREALEAWGDWLKSLMAGKAAPGNVINLNRVS